MILVDVVLAGIAFASIALVVLDLWARRKIRQVIGDTLDYERCDR